MDPSDARYDGCSTEGTRYVVHPLTTLPVAFVSEAILPVLRAADPGWRVHSVFRQSLNLIAGGHMVAVAPQAAGGLPNGIAVMGQPDFRALHVDDGAAVIGRWPAFELLQAGLRIDLGRAWTWSPILASGTIDQRDQGVRQRTALAADMVARRATRVGFGQCLALLEPLDLGAGPEQALEDDVVGAAARSSLAPETLDQTAVAMGLRAIESLRHALLRRELDATLRAVDALIGLGDGLTPSGDDLLVGLTAALRARGDGLSEPIARHAAARAPGATTDVARVALEHAARGEYAERLHGVLDTIARGDEAAIHAQVERALAWGASSGADTMLGVLIGLESSAAA